MDAKDWDARYAATDLVWSTDPNVWVVRDVESLTPGRALDLATGEGRNALWLARRGWTVTATDFSQVALDRGAALQARQQSELDEGRKPGRTLAITWQQADLRIAQLPEAAYDLVLLCYLQLPAAELSQLLPRCVAALAPGGTLLVVAHDSTNLGQGYGGPQDARVLYSAADVLSWVAAGVEAGGLEVEKAERVDRPIETPDGLKVARDALFLARRRS